MMEVLIIEATLEMIEHLHKRKEIKNDVLLLPEQNRVARQIAFAL